jgi:hypothetical protein
VDVTVGQQDGFVGHGPILAYRAPWNTPPTGPGGAGM